MHATAAAM